MDFSQATISRRLLDPKESVSIEIKSSEDLYKKTVKNYINKNFQQVIEDKEPSQKSDSQEPESAINLTNKGYLKETSCSISAKIESFKRKQLRKRN